MSALPDRRKQLIRLIHVAKRELGLDDEDYRAALKRETGKSSCNDMSEAQLDRALKAMKARGFNVKHSAGRVKQAQPAPASSRKPHRVRDGQAALITALWIDLWQLGAVRSNDDAAIDAFVKRQTGVERMQWLSPGKANQVIEALKDWCAREGFELPDVSDGGRSAKIALCDAILLKLDEPGRREFEEAVYAIDLFPSRYAEKLADRMGVRLRALLKERGE